MSSTMMKAVVVHEYGDADQLKLEEIPRPQPGEGEVLVEVRAAGVNPADWKIRSGMMKAFRPSTFPYVPGADLAGTVAEVGPGVTTLAEGQAVFGRGSAGTYAEYALAPAKTLATRPENMRFDEAATIAVGATTAWQGLFEHGQLQPGQRVLILGGAGGVGLFAVQFARWKGAHAFSTASSGNLEFLRELGAEQAIDYSTTQLENEVRDVDLVFDTVGSAAVTAAWPTIKRGGRLVSIAGQPDEAKATELGVQASRFSSETSSELLTEIARLIEAGQVRTVVGATFSLSEAAEAQELSRRGHGRGRIVLHVAG